MSWIKQLQMAPIFSFHSPFLLLIPLISLVCYLLLKWTDLVICVLFNGDLNLETQAAISSLSRLTFLSTLFRSLRFSQAYRSLSDLWLWKPLYRLVLGLNVQLETVSSWSLVLVLLLASSFLAIRFRKWLFRVINPPSRGQSTFLGYNFEKLSCSLLCSKISCFLFFLCFRCSCFRLRKDSKRG